jgi:acyl-homoserine lactone acylase PvdQ
LVVIWQEHLSFVGHNRDYAYGLTMFENDDIDFYQEENSPSNANKYKRQQVLSTKKEY